MAPRTRVRSQDRIQTDDAFLRCRTYNHAWDDFFPIDLAPPPFGWRLSLRCLRCATERHDLIDRKGAVMSRRYIYPDGYQTPKGEEHPEKSFYREAMFDKLRARLAETQNIAEELAKRSNGRKAS